MADKEKKAVRRHFNISTAFVILVFLYIHTVCSLSETCNSSNCLEGECVNGTCECHSGWANPVCQNCSGRVRLESLEGILTDGYGNYSKDNKCTWLVDTGRRNASLWFQFHQFSTECGWDHLYIYDGDSVFSPLIAAFSGLIWKEKTVVTELAEIQTHSGKAYVYFYSDAAYSMPGFNISYRTGGCPKNCSGHGTCMNEVCQCWSNWTGKSCSEEICPNNCSQNGICVNQKCSCFPEFTGEDCKLSADRASWDMKVASHESLGRVSAAVDTVRDSVYITGGYSFTKAQDFLFRYELQTQTIETITPLSTNNPTPRHGHSLVSYRHKLYVFGGVENNVTSKDLWIYNLATNSWKVKKYNTTIPVAVAGHTAHVVNGVMYVLFGYSPIYGYQNRIQEYHIDNDTWVVPRTVGALVNGGYGHSSVYDQETKKIYVYGGYIAQGENNYQLTDQLYSFEPLRRKWVKLRNNNLPRYLHSAVILDGLMLVFGGNTHNDTAFSKGAKCYSQDLLIYDIRCNKWSSLDTSDLSLDTAHYGHSAATYSRDGENSMLIFGGFNGIMQTNILKFIPGNCSIHQSEEECVKAAQGRTCVWYQGTCLSFSTVTNQGISYQNVQFKQCNPAEGQDEACKQITSCPTCLSTGFDCIWCNNNCTSPSQCTNTDRMPVKKVVTESQCLHKHSSNCELTVNCIACVQSKSCEWSTKDKCNLRTIKIDTHNTMSDFDPSKAQCKKPCYLNHGCENCTRGNCMWCSNKQQCVATNAYVATFIYGQCMEWTTDQTKCPATRCSDLHTCKQCQANPLCGWCNDPSNTGIGKCMEGGAAGPVNQSDKLQTDNSKCPANQWFFTGCPECQCNGHSTCLNVTGVCDHCQNMTEGKYCEVCKDGFYGDATNGGNCTACQCNSQADSCDRVTGKCNCRTRGVVGDKCDQCDIPHKYYGDPKKGTCYYNLVTDYQFTFNLSKSEDKYYTQINFMNIPTSSERDVDFKVNCSGIAFLNISVETRSGGKKSIVEHHTCNYFRAKFDHGEHSFGSSENTTFLVYVYGFKTPFWLQISFLQILKPINLLTFFAVFLGCFLSLLIIAAILYKIKHKYDNYRRRQRMMVEMEEMASRPFSSITVEIDKKYDQVTLEKKDTDLRKRKKISNKPSQIANEPLYHQKAAVVSLIVQLPTGDEEWTPNGASGVAIASALVAVGHHRKQSLEHGGKGDKSKHKKSLLPTSQDVCV